MKILFWQVGSKLLALAALARQIRQKPVRSRHSRRKLAIERVGKKRERAFAVVGLQHAAALGFLAVVAAFQ